MWTLTTYLVSIGYLEHKSCGLPQWPTIEWRKHPGKTVAVHNGPACITEIPHWNLVWPWLSNPKSSFTYPRFLWISKQVSQIICPFPRFMDIYNIGSQTQSTPMPRNTVLCWAHASMNCWSKLSNGLNAMIERMPLISPHRNATNEFAKATTYKIEIVPHRTNYSCQGGPQFLLLCIR